MSARSFLDFNIQIIFMIIFNPNNPEEMREAIEKMKTTKAKLKAIANPFLVPELLEKEVLEVCHLANFIISYDESLKIIEKRESPDFVVEHHGNQIGLEIERLFNLDEVQNIKSKQDLFKKAAISFEAKHPEIKILANFWLNDGFTFRGNEKGLLIEEITDFTYELISGNKPTYPIYIKDVDIMKHSRVSLNFNEGAYMVDDLPPENLIEAINKKEAKVTEYKANTGFDSQWLLLVSGIGSESFGIKDVELPTKIKSQFEHIFLLEDFDARVTKIK